MTLSFISTARELNTSAFKAFSWRKPYCKTNHNLSNAIPLNYELKLAMSQE